jgi:NitT/TauT family transport system substrate-binding protein
LAVLALAACQPRPELHIAHHTWIGYETLPLARELGWLPDNVVLHRLDNSTASARALASGEVAVAALTLDEALRLRATVADLQVVLVMNESAGADVLLARPGIGSLDDLVGARVAFERSAVSELLLRRALESAGLTLDDVRLVDLPVTAHEAAYRAGEVDAVVSYPPGAARVRELGAVRLFDSSQIPGTILDVLVVDPGQLDGRRATLAATVAAHFRALEHLRLSRDDAVYRIAALQTSTAARVREALAGVRLPAASSVTAYLQPDGALGSTAALLLEQDLLGEAADNVGLDGLVDARYLPKGDWQ